MSQTRELVDLIRGKAYTEADLHHAALFVLDAAANALAGRNSVPGRILLDWAAEQGDDPGRRALLIGGLTHILEVDDLHRTSVVHPGCVVVPASLALAPRLRASGLDLLVSVLQGFEACCRIGMAVGPGHYRIWHNTATCGPFGSAMAAASLMNLSAAQATDALGNAGTQSSGLWQFLDTGAMSKHLHAGRAAEAGVVAAGLARHGFTGPPAILEGARGFFQATCPDPEPEMVLAAPDAAWQLRKTSIKPWPCCRHTHPAIDAALELSKIVDLAGVVKVAVETYRPALDVCDRPLPSSEYEAKFSLQHCVAAALNDGRVVFDSFDEVGRARLAAVRERVMLSAVEPYISAYPGHWGASVTVTLDDGRVVAARRSDCKGDPESPLTADEMIAKARFLLSHGGVSDNDAQGIIDSVLALPEGDAAPDLMRWFGHT